MKVEYIAKLQCKMMKNHPEIANEPLTDQGILTQFESLSLNQMNGVKLLDRFDSKYCLQRSALEEILEEMQDGYFVLDVKGNRIQQYNTIYYDTPGNRFYLDHHNGVSNRMKLRKRAYVNSNLVYLEIKHKNNKGKTSKDRMKLDVLLPDLTAVERNFVKQNTFLNDVSIEPKFSSLFNRITLVSKNMKERCTIDTDLQLHSFGLSPRDLNDMVVIELKQDMNGQRSMLADVLKARKIYPCSFSKYCLGRAMNESGLKNNLFKAHLLKINKRFNIAE